MRPRFDRLQRNSPHGITVRAVSVVFCYEESQKELLLFLKKIFHILGINLKGTVIELGEKEHRFGPLNVSGPIAVLSKSVPELRIVLRIVDG